jgi:CubicO group peptidase (beta-lactamase class C family)
MVTCLPLFFAPGPYDGRMIWRVIAIGMLALTATGADAASISRQQVDEHVAPVLRNRTVGCLVIGVVDREGPRVYGFGRATDAKDSPPPDGKTVFEIGSITKTFTATLLADMVQKGEVRLDQPVRELLPADVTLPTRDGVEITLLHLSSQTSGLPRMPDNFDRMDPFDPYANYTPRLMYESLARLKLESRPGERFEYSNLGVGLLGHALARRAGKSFDELIAERIATPLDMPDTREALSESMRKRLTPGHNVLGVFQGEWNFEALAGAGAICSTADDMLKYLAAETGLSKTPLEGAMKLTRSPRADAGGIGDGMRIGLGWFITPKHGVCWHNGQTGGYRGFAAFAPKQQVGVVVLCNTATFGIDDVGFNLMRIAVGERGD